MFAIRPNSLSRIFKKNSIYWWLIQVKLYEPYRLGDSGTGVDPSGSDVVVVNTESVFVTSCPFIAVSEEVDDTK